MAFGRWLVRSAQSKDDSESCVRRSIAQTNQRRVRAHLLQPIRVRNRFLRKLWPPSLTIIFPKVRIKFLIKVPHKLCKANA